MDLAKQGAMLLLAALALPAAAQNAATLIDRALRLEHGEGVARDPAAAAALYCQAARLGAPQAQYALGWMYANGRGVLHDDGAAWRLFALAAEQAHPQAQHMLGLLAAAPQAALPACMAPEPALLVEAGDAAAELREVPAALRRLVERLAPQYEVDPALALAVMAVESGFNQHAVSPKNARGLMQLIPTTASRFCVLDAFNPEQNVRGGLAYLRWLLTRFGGDVQLAAAAYNAGEQAVEQYGGVPPYAETRAYVQRIAALYGKPAHPMAAGPHSACRRQ
ncbi:lytic transglycosylase domain-containing protein [Pseudoduganella violaceinigra]|uniref:lytic transglycosylase domain-containing protein n=1 Tax=Pseudoduganella violaceinigra TaxID=246602 RepID=UPI0004131067|nr:transglycosylase SLT domain-containing protein [Pseudoduganella violaceinigra]